jgi:hypothetical protein
MTRNVDFDGEKRIGGYKDPPMHTRFKPGQSGNPGGRQHGLRNLTTDVKKMLQEPVRITVGGKYRRISSQEAALKRLREKALNGDSRALDRLLAMAERHNGDAAEGSGAAPLADDDRAILDAYVLERAAEDDVGIPAAEVKSEAEPPPLPRGD